MLLKLKKPLEKLFSIASRRKMKIFRGLIMKVLFFLLLFLATPVVQAVPHDYLVFQWSESQGLSLYSKQQVDLPLRKYAQPMPQSGAHVLVENDSGEVLQVISLKSHSVTRSEHHGYNHIRDSSFENNELTFVVRVPTGQARRLQMVWSQKNLALTYDLKSMLKSAVIEPSAPQKSERGGTTDNRINLLFMGDGYLMSQSNLFDQHADTVMSYMLSFEPYASYGQFISFDRLFLESVEAGADHPSSPCGGVTDPQAPLFVNTRFDATYCTSGIHRLLTVNSSKVYTDAALFPGWDEIVMLVNDGTYGGSGGAFSTISAHAAAADVFIHEYGHSFTDLADEYETAYPGFPACSDINGPACEANVTDVNNRNDLKWNYFVDLATPVPTPDTAAYSQVTGLFEGARYLSSGMYRPVSACNMKFLGSSFCPVCQQAYVHKVYDVPYAEAGAKLSLIEPGTDVPSAGMGSAMVGQVLNLSFDSLQPTHELRFTWLVEGQVVSQYDSDLVGQSFAFTPSQNQTNSTVEVKIQVTDPSPVVHSSLQAQLPVFEHIWHVDVMPMVDLIFEHGFEN